MKYTRQTSGWGNVCSALVLEATWNWIRQRSGEDVSREEFILAMNHLPGLLKLAIWGGYYLRKAVAFFDKLRT